MSDFDDVKAAELKLHTATMKADIHTLDQLVDNHFVFIGPEGEINLKDGYLNDRRTHDIAFQRLDEMTVSVSSLGDGLTLVSQRVKAEWIVTGKPFAGIADYTRFWRSREGQWALLAERCSIPAPRG